MVEGSTMPIEIKISDGGSGSSIDGSSAVDQEKGEIITVKGGIRDNPGKCQMGAGLAVCGPVR
jgi:hypothetical protein